MKKPKAIFITGSSGVGKSTLVRALRDRSSDQFVVYDFDEVGIPDGADTAWRIETTGNWLDKAQPAQDESKVLVIIGLTQPDEVEQQAQERGVEVSFCMLDADAETLKRRLMQYRFSTAERIAEMTKYQGFTLEEFFVHNTNHVNLIRGEAQKRNAHIIDTTNLAPDAVTEQVSKWLDTIAK